MESKEMEKIFYTNANEKKNWGSDTYMRYLDEILILNQDYNKRQKGYNEIGVNKSRGHNPSKQIYTQHKSTYIHKAIFD